MAIRGANIFSIFVLAVIMIYAPTYCNGDQISMEVLTLRHPMVLCPKDTQVEETLKTDCKFGFYEFNPDPRNCKGATVCYSGLKESCDDKYDTKRCHQGLTCVEGKCYGCVPGGPCYLELRPVYAHKRYGKNIFERRT